MQLYRLVAVGTVEEQVLTLQARKAKLCRSLLEQGSGNASSKLSVDELLSFFA